MHLHSSPCAFTTLADAAFSARLSLKFASLQWCFLKLARRGQTSRNENRDVVYCNGSNPILCLNVTLFPWSLFLRWGWEIRSITYRRLQSYWLTRLEKCWELTVFVFLLFRVKSAISIAPVFHQFESGVGLFQEKMCSDSGIHSTSLVFTKQ